EKECQESSHPWLACPRSVARRRSVIMGSCLSVESNDEMHDMFDIYPTKANNSHRIILIF
ncbi:MAG TPA: hypothetical protein VFX72_04365, partial [Usitatibacteraceae bacterium]|nr:hypothetical protein [Usitatibacteraceae bacterium]